MEMFGPWRPEFFTVLLLTLVACISGHIFGSYLVAFWVGTVLYLFHHLVHTHRLLAWLKGGRGGQMPEGAGIWEEIYYRIYKLRRRNKRRKKQLLDWIERFRTATAALPDATVVLGPRDEIDWFNEAAGRLLGLRKSDLGQPIANLVRYPKFAEHLKNPREGSTVNIPAPQDERIQLEVRVVPYGQDSRLLIAQDVTQLRFMERVRSDFVANVSHELRTPLTVLKGYMETLLEGDERLPPSYRKVFRRVAEQSERMQNLVDNLLSLTRLESAPPKPPVRVDVCGMLRSLCEELREIHEREGEHAGVCLILDSEAALLGDETELRSAFSNLIQNAIKYTRPGDTVTVHWRDEGGGARLDVEDHGPGIPKEHLPRLTERFYRVEIEGSRNRSGTGLGLAIVKHVMGRHDGELVIASEPGRGSRFSCCFPQNRVIREEANVAVDGESEG
jgi:two-component system phosphate regulon sensor histidine kinase PhoR